MLLITEELCIQLARCDGLNMGDNCTVNRVIIFIKSGKDIGHKLIIAKSSAGGRHVVTKGSHLAIVFSDRELILPGCSQRNPCIHGTCTCLWGVQLGQLAPDVGRVSTRRDRNQSLSGKWGEEVAKNRLIVGYPLGVGRVVLLNNLALVILWRDDLGGRLLSTGEESFKFSGEDGQQRATAVSLIWLVSRWSA
jgi:hypothetical protein